MKKAVLIILVLLVGAFFMFFEINVGGNKRLDFLESYKTETGYTDFEAEMVYSTDINESGLRITFNGCRIDTTNMKQFGEISRKMAKQIHKELSPDSEFENIILIFKPNNPNGIPINNIMSIDELKFQHKISELESLPKPEN